MRFTTPLALLLLLAVPYLVWLGRPPKGPRRWRAWASLALRLLIILLLVLSLAGVQIARAGDELAVIFLVDDSDSIRPQQSEHVEAFIRQVIEEMEANDQAAIILFGANALVDRPISALAEMAPVTSVVQSLHTDIAEAIRLGLALFPAGSARRMVLLSDGAATQGDALEAARLASASGVQIDVIPLDLLATTAEALLTSVRAPARVNQGETFTVNVTVDSTTSMNALLRVLAGGLVIHEATVSLRPGTNNFPVRLRATSQEFARYSVQLTPSEDTFFQNNELATFTEVMGPPHVLLVAERDSVDDAGNPVADESPQLRLALEATGLTVDRATPAELPSSLEGLADYATVVLVNINAKNLSTRKMQLLQSYVRDLGGGLVAVGGPESYGMGGYFQTELEETLPVDMQIKDEERFPSVSLVLVIDRSGSMGAPEGGVTKIQLAAEGAARVVELLNDFDEITIIPVDTQPDNPIGPASAAEREEIIGQIRQIGAGGGGIFVRTGLEAAADALAQSANQVKHVIVLADGADSEQKEGVPELIEALVAEDVTVSTVSIGDGPDVPWLQQMAELGGGRFHFTNRAANLPQIFTQETTAIQRSYLVEERFFPSLSAAPFASRHAIYRALDSARLTSVPALFGYVGTSPKAAAQLILETHLGDPLLAAWEYGLGRSVAWTSDATGRWAAEWARWSGFPTFWSNIVRWTISQARDGNVETEVNFSEEEARLVVSARASSGVYLNELSMIANVISPDGETTSLALNQTAPGRYEGTFSPQDEGAYFIRVSGSDQDGVAVAQTAGWVLGYSPEYRLVQAETQLLTTIAEITGGRVLTAGNVDEARDAILAHNLESEAATRPIWPLLTLIATVLLPLDIALRRLVLTRRDLELAWAATFGRLPLPVGRRQEAADLERSEQVSRLFQAKQRVTARAPERRTVDTAIPGEMLSPPAGEGERQEIAEGSPDRPAPRPTQEAKEGKPGQQKPLAARLLERRQRQQQDDEKRKTDS